MNAIAERDTWFEINLQSWKEIPEIRSTNQPHKEHIIWNGYFLTVSTGGSERERSLCLWEVDLIRRSFFADDLSEFSEKEKIVSGEFGGWEILTDELALFLGPGRTGLLLSHVAEDHYKLMGWPMIVEFFPRCPSSIEGVFDSDTLRAPGGWNRHCLVLV